jgi:hypothetical protein
MVLIRVELWLNPKNCVCGVMSRRSLSVSDCGFSDGFIVHCPHVEEDEYFFIVGAQNSRGLAVAQF